MKIERLREIAEFDHWVEAPSPDEAHEMARELLALRDAMIQCDRCFGYHVASVLRTTAEGVKFCPACWVVCCGDDAVLNPPEAEQG